MEQLKEDIEITNSIQIRLAEKLGISMEEFARDYSETFRQLYIIYQHTISIGKSVSIEQFEESAYTMCTLYRQRFLTKKIVHGILEDIKSSGF